MKTQNFTLVLLEDSETSAKVKLHRILYRLYLREKVTNFLVLVVSRWIANTGAHRAWICADIRDSEPDTLLNSFAENLFYLPFELVHSEGYQQLKTMIYELEKTRGISGKRVFFIAVNNKLCGLTLKGLCEVDLLENISRTQVVIIPQSGNANWQLERELKEVIKPSFQKENLGYWNEDLLGEEALTNIIY